MRMLSGARLFFAVRNLRFVHFFKLGRNGNSRIGIKLSVLGRKSHGFLGKRLMQFSTYGISIDQANEQ